jgi:hypothetical protein
MPSRSWIVRESAYRLPSCLHRARLGSIGGAVDRALHGNWHGRFDMGDNEDRRAVAGRHRVQGGDIGAVELVGARRREHPERREILPKGVVVLVRAHMSELKVADQRGSLGGLEGNQAGHPQDVEILGDDAEVDAAGRGLNAGFRRRLLVDVDVRHQSRELGVRRRADESCRGDKQNG